MGDPARPGHADVSAPSYGAGMLIDCETCVRDVACRDCVVTFVSAGRQAAGRTEFTEAEGRAFAVLAGSGLVPPLRLRGRERDTG